MEDEPPSPTVVEPVRKCPFTRENKPPAPEEMLLDSENDYESEEEDGLYPYIPPVVKAFNRVHPSSPASYALWTPATFGGDHPYLRELFDLRRRKLELETRTIDLSDQLAAARAESSRARAAQRAIESMLEAEQKKRARAERVANEESKLRRAAEDALGRACTAEGTAMMA